jgi:hypothetical protein
MFSNGRRVKDVYRNTSGSSISKWLVDTAYEGSEILRADISLIINQRLCNFYN